MDGGDSNGKKYWLVIGLKSGKNLTAILAYRVSVSGLNKTLLAQKEVTGILQTKNGGKQFLTIPIEPDGSFFVPDILFFDTARIFYQFNNDKDKV